MVILLLAIPIAISLFLMTHWPYGFHRIQPSLNKAFHGDVHIESFHAFYYPYPGFEATGLVLRRGLTPAAAAANPAPPLASAERVLVQGRYRDLLTLQHRVRLVEVDGLHVVIPPPGSTARAQDFPPGDGKDFSGPRTLIDDLHVKGALLELERPEVAPHDASREDPEVGRPFLLKIHDIDLRDVVKDRAAAFSLSLQNPKPDALIEARGSLGPLHSLHLADTPLHADFTFAHGQLENFKGMHGILDGKGHFQGILSAIDLSAEATSTAFAVNKGQPVDVSNVVRATVDGLNGDTILHSIDAHTGQTTVHGVGSVTGHHKLTQMDLKITHGRIQDVMRPFLHTEPPVSGDLHLTGHATLDPPISGRKFLERLTMDGTFDVPDELFTKGTTERSLSAFSRRAQGVSGFSRDAKPRPPGPNGQDAPVLLSVRGPVHLGNGIASTRRLDVSFPGASMHLAGTFDMHTTTAHLTGNLEMQSGIAQVTTGIRSFLLRPLNPFFRHHTEDHPEGPKVTVVPIAITGTRHFKVSSNLRHKR